MAKKIFMHKVYTPKNHMTRQPEFKIGNKLVGRSTKFQHIDYASSVSKCIFFEKLIPVAIRIFKNVLH